MITLKMVCTAIAVIACALICLAYIITRVSGGAYAVPKCMFASGLILAPLAIVLWVTQGKIFTQVCFCLTGAIAIFLVIRRICE